MSVDSLFQCLTTLSVKFFYQSLSDRHVTELLISSCQVILGQHRDRNLGISDSKWVKEDWRSSAFPPVSSICCLPHELVTPFKAFHLALPVKKNSIKLESRCPMSSGAFAVQKQLKRCHRPGDHKTISAPARIHSLYC